MFPFSTPSPQVTKKYFILYFNPTVIHKGVNKTLSQLYGWNSPYTLSTNYANDIRSSSKSYLNYVEAGRLEVDAWVPKTDGFVYNATTYMTCYNSNGANCHSPDTANYNWILSTYGICSKLNNCQIDELRMFGGGWFGFYEANQAGTGAIHTNGPPITGTSCNRPLNIVGFNPGRGQAEMLEDMAHRISGAMKNSGRAAEMNAFEKWDKTSPGQAACGTVHLAPNSQHYEIENGQWQYDRVETVSKWSTCDTYYLYPYTLTNYCSAPFAQPRYMSCTEWGCGQPWTYAREHQMWWLKHIPHFEDYVPGTTKTANWWAITAPYWKTCKRPS